MSIASIVAVLPFTGVLLSIAFLPLVLPKRWHIIENYVLLFWGVLGTFSIFFLLNPNKGFSSVLHMILEEYIPFVSLITALYIISSGIVVRTHLCATPLVNAFVLLVGSILSNFIGTMGASMILIRPYLHINRHRKNFSYGVIFFVFCVANISGCLSSIGDPPLFLGFLKGISFWWPLKVLWPVWIVTIPILITIFFVFDNYHYKKNPHVHNKEISNRIFIHGKINFFLLLSVVLILIASSSWHGHSNTECLGVKMCFYSIIRDICILSVAFFGYLLMPQKTRNEQLNWAPVKEVCKVFLAIFITLIPFNILLSSQNGEYFTTISKVLNTGCINKDYFWLSSLFSAFLDNAPTYLVFFDLAGANPYFLMNEGKYTLAAISLGTVFAGALTYIGNAPNFMIRSIAHNYKIHMPSFFAYVLWSLCILLPIFYGVSLWLGIMTS